MKVSSFQGINPLEGLTVASLGQARRPMPRTSEKRMAIYCKDLRHHDLRKG